MKGADSSMVRHIELLTSNPATDALGLPCARSCSLKGNSSHKTDRVSAPRTPILWGQKTHAHINISCNKSVEETKAERYGRAWTSFLTSVILSLLR